MIPSAEAYEIVRTVARRTPLLSSLALDELAGRRLYVKAESLQHAGSFKFRGAYYRLTKLDAPSRVKGVVAYSSGNFAQGLARAGQLLGVPVTIVMPRDVPALKVTGTRRYGARIVFSDAGDRPREAAAGEMAEQVSRSEGLTLLHPFDDAHVVTGHSSLGIEMLDQLTELHDDVAFDSVLVPAGGGGLAAGVSVAFRERSPSTQVIVVEPEGYDDISRSLIARERRSNDVPQRTLCDALQAVAPGVVPFAELRDAGRSAITVGDDDVRTAMRAAVEHLKLVLEPSGAIALAAALSAGRNGNEIGQRVGVVCSGGNIAPAEFARLVAE